MFIVSLIVLEAEHVMAGALRSGGGQVDLAGIAETYLMIHRHTLHTVKLLKAERTWRNARCFKSLFNGMRFV
jgi:hypothetical protein